MVERHIPEGLQTHLDGINSTFAQAISLLNSLRMLTMISIVTAGCLPLAGCSYLFRAGAEGNFLNSNRVILGYVSSGNELEGGSIAFGSELKEECQGNYKVEKEGFYALGVSFKERVYQGRIFCLDGRYGSFQFVSKNKGRDGIISGDLGGESFRVVISDAPRAEGCVDDYCRWGIRWTYESERKQGQIYAKVEAESEKMKSITSSTDTEVNPDS